MKLPAFSCRSLSLFTWPPGAVRPKSPVVRRIIMSTQSPLCSVAQESRYSFGPDEDVKGRRRALRDGDQECAMEGEGVMQTRKPDFNRYILSNFAILLWKVNPAGKRHLRPKGRSTALTEL